jgi:hypothetical protein
MGFQMVATETRAALSFYHHCARAHGLVSAMNKREMIDLCDLLDRIDGFSRNI